MKYLLVFLIVLSLFNPYSNNEVYETSFIRNVIYKYITSLDNTIDYALNNVPYVQNLASSIYEKRFEKIMLDKTITKHFVYPGETLDEILKKYNKDTDNINTLRKIVLFENPDVVSDSYDLQSNTFINVPSDSFQK